MRHGVAVYTYDPSVMHAKTAIFDERIVIVGSHNLDTFSWRFDLEANVRVDDRAFATTVVHSFERDLLDATRLVPAAARGLRRSLLLSWAADRIRACF